MIMIVLAVIFVLNIAFSQYQQGAPGVQMIIGPLVTLVLFSTPAVTMRLLADEQKMGTLELLLTAPLRDWELVAGKWLGGLLFYGVIALLTWVFPILLNLMVDPGIDQGLLITNYLGLILLIGSFLAIGVLISSFFSNSIAAFFVTLAALLIFWLVGSPAQIMTGTAAEIFRYLDLREHFFTTFYIGTIELKDIVYYISFIFFALFLSTVSVEARRWR
jgi:ABC-2 type transport system permease protein